MRMQTKAPSRKVVAATGSGGIGVYVAEILVYLLEQFHQLPESIEVAVTALTVAACVALAGYFTPPAPDDRPV